MTTHLLQDLSSHKTSQIYTTRSVPLHFYGRKEKGDKDNKTILRLLTKFERRTSKLNQAASTRLVETKQIDKLLSFLACVLLKLR